MTTETLKAAWEAATSIKKIEKALQAICDRSNTLTITARVDVFQGNESCNLRFIDISRDLIGALPAEAETELQNIMRDAMAFMLERELAYAQQKFADL